ncbi:hypothetical protein [Prosthecobacter sp.]|uniref:hypothetical protein n=1 Tax=Prosthecobacter sp. TaxID=1965333 RepID=UPI001DB111A5|nr:hypothetical protein [Prosthecobacter sp.]MCB1275309.1 hypothetical protein [Prosthecobacter sp.]
MALRANERVKQRRHFKNPVQSNILVGDKAADKTTDLSINHLFGQVTAPPSSSEMAATFQSVRRHDANGIPELPESIDALSAYVSQLDDVPRSRLKKEQAAVLDVFSAMGGIGCNGLHCFWDNSSGLLKRVLRSFRVVGAEDVLGILKESEWAFEVVRRGTDAHGHYAFTPDEEHRLNIIEDRLYHSFVGLPTRLHHFCLERGFYSND